MNKIQSLIAQHCPNGVEYRKLGEVSTIKTGKSNAQDAVVNGIYPLFDRSQTIKRSNRFLFDDEAIIVAGEGNFTPKYFNGKFDLHQRAYAIYKIKQAIPKFVFYSILSNQKYFKRVAVDSTVISLRVKHLEDFPIPLPPIPVQEEIVRILDAFTELQTELQTELELRKKQYQYYRDKLLCFENINGGGGLNVEYKTLGEIGEVKMCKRIFKDQTSSSGDIPFFKIGTFGKEPDAFISEDLFISYKSKYPYPKKGDILISASGTIGKTIIFDGSPSYFQDSNIVWIDNNEEIVLNKYLYYFYQIAKWEVSGGGTIVRLYNDGIRHTKIPLPPLEEQKRIVEILDRFDKLVNDISIGIPAEIEMRKKQYEYYRDRLLSFEGVC